MKAGWMGPDGARISGPYLRRLSGRSRGPAPTRDRGFGVPSRLTVTSAVLAVLVLGAMLAWGIAASHVH